MAVAYRSGVSSNYLSNVPDAELEIGHCSKIVTINMTKAFLVL